MATNLKSVLSKFIGATNADRLPDRLGDVDGFPDRLAGDGATLQFTFATPNATTGEMLMQDVGTGTPVHTHTADILQPEEATVKPYYSRFGANVEVYRGGRVVKNKIPHSEDFTNAAWIVTNATPVYGVADPDGGNTAVRITATATNGNTLNAGGSQGYTLGNNYIQSVWIRQTVGTGAVQILKGDTSGWVTVSGVDGTWRRHTIAGISTGAISGGIGVRAATSGDQIEIAFAQSEDATGRLDTATPSEYVKTTTAAVTKTFWTENGNSVASNVVTEAVGDPLAQTPWLWFQPGPRTNKQIRSNDLADAEWTVSNMTVGDQDEVGLEGVPNTACKLTATAGNATLIANALTAASDDQTTRWFLKRETGTGDIDLTLDNGSTWTTVTIDGDFDEYLVDQAALANPQIGIRIVTSGDEVIVGNAEAYTATQKEEVEGLGPIFTTTAAAATDKTVYEYPEANLETGSGVIYFELYSTQGGGAITNPADANARLISFGTSGYVGVTAADGKLSAYDGTNAAASDAAVPALASRCALVYSAADSKMVLCVDGTYGAEATFSGTMSINDDIFLGRLTDFCFGLRNGKHYSGIANLDAGKDIVDELMIADGIFADNAGSLFVDNSGNYIGWW